MKRAISLLLVIVMTTMALAGCDSKSENPAGNANSKQSTDESITIKNSPDKYTWYIKNYVGKNCAPIGYTSVGGDRMDHYGAGYIELVMVAPDGAFVSTIFVALRAIGRCPSARPLRRTATGSKAPACPWWGC